MTDLAMKEVRRMWRNTSYSAVEHAGRNGRVSIVVPCYNEADRLDRSTILDFLGQSTTFQLLFVDDGSTDKTAELLTELCEASDGRASYLRLERNHGKAEAVRCGLLAAATSGVEYVGYWDADLATPLEEIPIFLAILERQPELELVMGSRVKLLGRRIDRYASRHYVGRVFATVVSLMLRLPVYDTQCGAKLFRASDELFALLQVPFLTRWIFDVEIIARMMYWRDARVTETVYEHPVSSWEDVNGSKLVLRDFLRSGPDLFRIYWLTIRRGGALHELPRPDHVVTPETADAVPEAHLA